MLCVLHDTFLLSITCAPVCDMLHLTAFCLWMQHFPPHTSHRCLLFQVIGATGRPPPLGRRVGSRHHTVLQCTPFCCTAKCVDLHTTLYILYFSLLQCTACAALQCVVLHTALCALLCSVLHCAALVGQMTIIGR